MNKVAKLVIAVFICELIGIIGASFTIPSIPTWYAGLQKPSFSPPNWIFSPVWTALYFLMGVSLYLVWQNRVKGRRQAIKIFMIQLVLNLLWSILFFYQRSPLAAFVEIVILWSAILATIFFFYRISKAAAYILIPYLLWVSFAAILNLSIYLLN
ncbi:MAG: TspO/MBR family protein [Candidatus Woesearchaeota archaeon]